MRPLLLALVLTLTAAGQGTTNPSSFGRPSNLDPTVTTGTIQAGSRVLTLGGPASFLPGQGVLIAHAGPPCGIARGTPCPSGPRPALAASRSGPPASYRTACIDGLGGISAAGPSVSSPGPATLTLPPLPGCIAVAIYRDSRLIALQYASLAAPYSFADTGQPPVPHHRDLPLTPPDAPLADNLPAQIATLDGSTVTLTAPAPTGVRDAQVFHSDTPLVQAAINHGGNLAGDTSYRVNYPISFVDRGGTLTLSLLCDTADVCLDATGQYYTTLRDVALHHFGPLTQSSTIGLLCARDRARPTSQHLNSDHLLVDLGPALSPTGHGSVAFYNNSCEIENHLAPELQAEQLVVLTSTNLWNVHSPFTATELSAPQSMSQVTFEQPTGGTPGVFYTLDNAYSINIFGGYHLGGNSLTSPWAFDLFGQNADLHIQGLRTEARGGFAHLHPHARLIYSTIDMGLYRANSTTPALLLEDDASVSQLHFRADDYGASPTSQPVYHCATANCSFADSRVDTGFWQTFDPAHALNVEVLATRTHTLTHLGPTPQP